MFRRKDIEFKIATVFIWIRYKAAVSELTNSFLTVFSNIIYFSSLMSELNKQSPRHLRHSWKAKSPLTSLNGSELKPQKDPKSKYCVLRFNLRLPLSVFLFSWLFFWACLIRWRNFKEKNGKLIETKTSLIMCACLSGATLPLLLSREL